MSAVRAILFDFHETLVSADRWMAMETGGIAFEVLQTLGIWTGAPPPDARRRVEEIYPRLETISRDAGIEFSAHQIARICSKAFDPKGTVAEAAIPAGVDALFRSYIPDVTAKYGVPETLETLARAGHRMGVISNARHGPFLSWALEAIGLLRHFERITVSADVGIRKPRGEIFAAGLRAMSLAADETVYVGNDYIKDVMGAKLAGMRAVWMPEPGAVDFGQYSPVKPDAVADRFDALPEIVRRWRARESQPAPRGGGIRRRGP